MFFRILYLRGNYFVYYRWLKCIAVSNEQQPKVRKGLLDKFAVKSDVAKLCEMS